MAKKKEKKDKKEKKSKDRISIKKLLKKSKTTYKMPDRPIHNVFEDENRFFRGAIKNEF